MTTMPVIPTPSLFIVSKFDQRYDPQTIDPVDPALAEDLRHFFESPNSADSSAMRAEAKVTKLSVDHLWLMCGCLGRPSKKSAVLYGQRTPRGKVRKAVLVPLYARAEHEKNCPFFKAAPDPSDAPSMLARKKKVKGFAVLEALDQKGGDERTLNLKDNADLKMDSCQKLPTIARVLFTILDGAKVNVVSGELLPVKAPESPRYLSNRSVTDDKEAIRNYLNHRQFAFGATLEAIKGFEFSFSTLKKLRQTLSDTPREHWGKFEPHGFLIDQVANYERVGEKWELENPYKDKIEVDGRLYIPGENTPGPWLAICLVVQLPGDVLPCIHRAYLHPLESFDNFMLVDSDLERKTFAILRRKRLQMAKANKPYNIIKPLLDIIAENGDKSSVRPDFIVENRRGKLVVETMGYTDATYQERKKRTHPIMQKLKDVKKLIEHHPQSESEFTNKLDAFIG